MTKVRDIMAGRVVTARHDDTLRTVAKRMREHEIGALPVLGADDQLIGIVTDRDIVRRAVADGRPDTTKAAEVMTPNPVTISPEESTRTAAKIMSERQIRRLPVVEGERVVGMLAVKDLTEDQASLKMVDTVIREVSEDTAEHRSEVH